MAKDPKKKEKKEQKNNFIKEVNSELKKVTWPTRKDLVTSTGTVLLITLTIAVIVFVLDFAFEKANTYGVEKLKAVVSASQEEPKSADDVNNDESKEVTTDEQSTEDTPVNDESTNASTETETQSENTENTEEAAQ